MSSWDCISELFANELLIMKVGLYTFRCFGEDSLVSDAPVWSRSPLEAYPLMMAEELIPAAPVEEDDIFFPDADLCLRLLYRSLTCSSNDFLFVQSFLYSFNSLLLSSS